MTGYSAFFYGSLMSNTVLARVLCGAKVSEKDKTLKLESIRFLSVVLKGYTRSSLKGEEYPAITTSTGGQVTGILAQGLTAKDIEALDVFEGDWYQRIMVQVTHDQEVIDTEAYLYIGDQALLTGQEWDFDQFLTSGKEQKWLDDRCDFYEVDTFHQV
ncbi:hypothetical protein BDF21DRAFT_421830 [Thamnidium elegans]|nr:hypothetical protein BDF21DRAFT_421830 [Thamnidium elegans]